MPECLAEKGFTVATISYRLAPRFTFPAQLVDCRDALRWMGDHAGQYKIDPGRSGRFWLFGRSSADLSSGQREPSTESGLDGGKQWCDPGSQLRAVVAGGTPCDLAKGTHGTFLFTSIWVGLSDQFPERLPPGLAGVARVGRLPTELFLPWRGGPPGAAGRRPEAMSSRLRELGVRSEVYLVSGKGHIGAFHDDSAIERPLNS